MTITGKARLAGVIGWPVAHSRSPQLHGYWLRHHGINGAYVPLPVRPGELTDALRALPKLGFVGANLTVPHKQAALPVLDIVDELARRIGAVNTIVVDADRGLIGTNTDAFGFIENLRDGAPRWRAQDGPALVIGAGGAARAVCVALLDAGVGDVRIVNRTQARAQAVAETLGGTILAPPWRERQEAADGAALLVNATTLGMDGQPPLEFDLASLPAAAVVSDIVYTPLETPLLAAAQARGHVVVDGLGMLLHQARPGFEAWFGIAPTVTAELRRAVLHGGP